MSGFSTGEFEPSPSHDPDDLSVLSLEDERAERLISSLSSETARDLYAALRETPATASELATEVTTSLQNVRHHLSNLRDAGLVRVADTRYSCKGREMKVYAPARDALVVCVGPSDEEDRLVDVLAAGAD